MAFDLVLAAGAAAVGSGLGFPPVTVFLLALAVSAPLAAWSLARFWGPVRGTLSALADGVRSFQENDFSLRLAVTRRDELAELVTLYNRMGDVLRVERNDIYQRELLLDTLLQGAPMAILLVNPLERIVFANAAARQLFGGSRRLEGRAFSEVLDAAPESARGALAAGQDALFTWPGAGAESQEETYRIVQRRFHLNTQEQRLVVVERITPELRRQEVETWKKVIRVLSHELNNSLASVSSLLHSARHVAVSGPQPGAAPAAAGTAGTRLEDILASIDERVRHLSDFLEGYARFARLPKPVKRRAEWGELLDSVGRLFPFRRIGDVPSEPGFFDPVQMQQVLINLLKNAAEAGGASDEIAVAIERGRRGGWLIVVLDRGRGMDEETMRRALLPFYSSKESGSGLGLPLCNEIVVAHGGALHLERRSGGGTAVVCAIPDPD